MFVWRLQGDEKMRSALYKLRQTWKGLLPDLKLYMIDALTKKIDPNWPICPSLEHLASSIHLNPKFFGRQPPTIEVSIIHSLFLVFHRCNVYFHVLAIHVPSLPLDDEGFAALI